MGNFNRGSRFGGGNRNSGFTRGDRSDRPSMHSAICADCGKDCEVPFKPSGDKPVYCSNCFSARENSSSRNERRFTVRESRGDKKMFKAVCSKCHRDCEVPFRPTTDKPIFCNDCFGRGEKKGSDNNRIDVDKYKKDFEVLNDKLDNILDILSSKVLAEEKIKEVVEEKVEKPKKVKKTAVKKIDKEKTKAKKVSPKKTVKKKSAKKK